MKYTRCPYNNIHKVTNTDYVWFEFLWIRRYYSTMFKKLQFRDKKNENSVFEIIFFVKSVVVRGTGDCFGGFDVG